MDAGVTKHRDLNVTVAESDAITDADLEARDATSPTASANS